MRTPVRELAPHGPRQTAVARAAAESLHSAKKLLSPPPEDKKRAMDPFSLGLGNALRQRLITVSDEGWAAGHGHYRVSAAVPGQKTAPLTLAVKIPHERNDAPTSLDVTKYAALKNPTHALTRFTWGLAQIESDRPQLQSVASGADDFSDFRISDPQDRGAYRDRSARTVRERDPIRSGDGASETLLRRDIADRQFPLTEPSHYSSPLYRVPPPPPDALRNVRYFVAAGLIKVTGRPGALPQSVDVTVETIGGLRGTVGMRGHTNEDVAAIGAIETLASRNGGWASELSGALTHPDFEFFADKLARSQIDVIQARIARLTRALSKTGTSAKDGARREEIAALQTRANAFSSRGVAAFQDNELLGFARQNRLFHNLSSQQLRYWGDD